MDSSEKMISLIRVTSLVLEGLTLAKKCNFIYG